QPHEQSRCREERNDPLPRSPHAKCGYSKDDGSEENGGGGPTFRGVRTHSSPEYDLLKAAPHPLKTAAEAKRQPLPLRSSMASSRARGGDRSLVPRGSGVGLGAAEEGEEIRAGGSRSWQGLKWLKPQVFREDLIALFDLLGQKKLSPVIARRFPLAE